MSRSDTSCAAIFGCSGPTLTDDERAFFRETSPTGLILFGRNCETPRQIRALVDDFCQVVGRDQVPVLIDQEGGRVARLRPPHWREAPPARTFGELYAQNPEASLRAVWLNGRLLAADLFALGITVNCVPVLDLPASGSHDIIGDRAFSDDAETVIRLATAMIDGLEAGGVQPVVKHIPGHGRARADSHEALPRVENDMGTLAKTDLVPFRALASAPWAMTAHIIYAAIDDELPATHSPLVIEQVVRNEIGFEGVLMTDDLSMKALSGDFHQRARTAVRAGCDLVLHCNGDLGEMKAVAEGAGTVGGEAMRRLDRARSMSREPEEIDTREAENELNRLLASLGGA